jgi:hypothetical protein
MSSDDGKLDAQTPAVDATVPELDAGSSRTQDLLDADSVDAVYRAKMHVVNDAMQEIGMGRYQVRSSFYFTRSWADEKTVGPVRRRGLRLLCRLGLAAPLWPGLVPCGKRVWVLGTFLESRSQHWAPFRRYHMERRL